MPDLIERITTSYENLSEKYEKETTNFNKQYFNIYLTRLKEMSKILFEKIETKWNTKDYPIVKLHKVVEQNSNKCIIIGTLFKNQKLKPSVLKHLAESNKLLPQPIITHFTDESDQLFIEDELQRYQLIGALKQNNLVTGITCALFGYEADTNGKFFVEDYVFAGFPSQIERPIPNITTYILFISGLDLINAEKHLPNLHLLIHWISGFIDEEGQSQITRLIIAGNSTRTETDDIKSTVSLISKTTVSNETIQAVELFDSFLLQLTKVIEVDVMPGEHDPSNHILPQKQMHHCMFPKSGTYQSLNQVTNPYYCSVEGTKILGCSGQNIRDILRYSDITDPLEALESCLQWGHLAPTAPDTLGCFPFYETDPFIIEDCPHVFFVGNQKEFSTKTCKGENGQSVCLISIPEFATTFQACLLDLKTLNCNKIEFNVI